MGQVAGLIGGAVGAVAGGFFGGPMGAEAGFMLGSMLGSALFPAKGPAPTDVRVQDSAYGKFIPWVWGKYRVAGNMIWAGTPHNHSASGKGGSGKSEGQHTTMSFAVALCRGEVQAVNRIWANGKLIYDTSNPSDWKSISGSASQVTGWTLYNGSETQGQDPLQVAQYGANAVPAYRGIAYVSFNELDLYQWGNYLPSLSFEVIANAQLTTVVSGAQTLASAQSPGIGVPSSRACQILSDGTVNGMTTGLLASNSSQGAVQFFQMTAYGVQWLSSPIGVGVACVPFGQCLSNDGDFGVMDTSGVWHDSGGLIKQYSSFQTGLVQGSGITAVKSNNILYAASTSITGPLFIVPLTPVLNALVPFSSSGAADVRSMCVIGVSADRVYCACTAADTAYPNSIISYDLNGNFMGVLIANYGGSGTVADVVSDTEIYFQFFTIPVGVSQSIFLWNGTSLTPTSLTPVYVANCSCLKMMSPSIAMLSNVASGPTFYALVQGATAATTTLGEIVSDVCEMAGMSSGQFDVSALTDTVVGYANTNNATPRDMLTPLLNAFFVDVSDSDGKLKFIKRGAVPGVTIPWDDLGVDTEESSDVALNPIQETITQEFDLPYMESLSYISTSTDYQTGTQHEFMPGTVSNLMESLNTPIVMADNDAKVRVQALLWERWSKRRSFQFATSYKYMQFEPGDTVQVARPDGSLLPLRVTKVQFNGKGQMQWNADFTVPSIYPAPGTQTYTAQAATAAGFNKQSITYAGPTILAAMDLPPLRAQDATSAGLYLACGAFADDWPGATVQLSRDDTTFTNIFAAVNRSIIGYTTTTLGAFSGGNIPDELNTVNVILYDAADSLSSVSYASFLNEAQGALIGTELVYFRNAVQNSDGSWTLSGFLRYRLDTDNPAPVHGVGERFVFLNTSAVSVVPLNLSDAGQTIYIDAFLNSPSGSGSASATTVQPTNMRLAPFAPHRLSAAAGAYNTLGATTDITVKWFRKARINNGWYDGVDVPLDWQQESYQIAVYRNGSLANTYTLASNGITWTGGYGTSQPVPQGINAGGVSVSQGLPPFAAPTQPYFVYTNAMQTNDGTATSGVTIQFIVRQVGDYGIAGHTSTVSITR